MPLNLPFKKFGLSALMLAGLTGSVARADIVVTFPEVNLQDPPYPSSLVDWSNQGFTLDPSLEIVSATFSGVFGDTSQFNGSSAGAQLFINGNEVEDIGNAAYYSDVGFSVSLDPTALASLEGGEADLGVIQEGPNVVRLSSTTLDIKTASVPDVGSSAALLLLSVAGLLGFSRFVGARRAAL